jgi:hypothetical protein
MISIIRGTLDASDILDALTGLIEDIGGYGELVKEAHNLLEQPTETPEQVARVQVLVSEIQAILQCHAPDGQYFGAHPRDPFNIGFWNFSGEDDD